MRDVGQQLKGNGLIDMQEQRQLALAKDIKSLDKLALPDKYS